MSVDDEAHDFGLARRQTRHFGFNCRSLGPNSAASDVLLDRLADSGQKELIVERLFDEVHCPSAHGTYGNGNVSVSGNNDDRQRNVRFGQLFLKLQSADAGHPYVRDNTSKPIGIVRIEKDLGAVVGRDVKSARLDHPFQRLADGGVVVDHVDDRLVRVHCDRFLGATGSVK